MARPKKQTVDYFPHMVTSGKTMFILESQFGNDGYALWFKLLELIGTSDGHVYDCGNSSDWQFLIAKTNLTEGKALEILNLLSELGAIDKELWAIKVVWVQNFVENIADVYKKRRVAIPQKPDINSFGQQKPTSPVVSDSENSEKDDIEPVSTTENPQSKVKETKGNESKVATTDGGDNLPERFNALSSFEQLWAFPNFVQNEDLNHLIDQYDDDLVTAAVKLAGSKDVKKGQALSFIESALREWADNNVKTVNQAREYQKNRNKQFKPKQNNWSNNKSNARSESLPDWAENPTTEKDTYDEELDNDMKERLARIRAKKEANNA